MIKGGELFDKIIDLGGFDEAAASTVFKELMGVMSYTHSCNIMHRDLKPENILLDLVEGCNQKYSIKVIDWGTAEIYSKNKKLDEIVGTPYYIAPEVLNESYDEACDVWSCGVILYILLTGEPPFGGESDEVIFHRIKSGNLPFSSDAAA